MLDYLRIMLNARLARDEERGASAVEYGLLIAGIAALIVVVGVRPRPDPAARRSATPATAINARWRRTAAVMRRGHGTTHSLGGKMAAAGYRSRHLRSWT